MALRQNLWGHRFVFVLAGVLAVVFSSPLADEPGIGRIVVHVLFTVFVLLSIYVTSSSRTWVTVISVLVAAWLAVAWSGLGGPQGALTWLGALLLMTVCFLVFVIVEKAVLLAPAVDANVLCGGIACYFLIAIFWAMSFALIEWMAPGSLRTGEDIAPTWSDLMYFSMTCLTTLGFGDIIPLQSFARLWSSLEAAIGMIYLSVFVARLVSLYKS
jgi:hypothetical protein